MEEKIIAEALCEASTGINITELECEIAKLKLTNSMLYKALENTFINKKAA